MTTQAQGGNGIVRVPGEKKGVVSVLDHIILSKPRYIQSQQNVVIVTAAFHLWIVQFVWVLAFPPCASILT